MVDKSSLEKALNAFNGVLYIWLLSVLSSIDLSVTVF
jgi:hypothetical protein